MKAMLLAAGLGTRLRSLTDRIPKCMLPVGGKPILEHNLEWLKRYGISEVMINLYHLPQAVMGYFGDGSPWGMKISYSLEKEILGTAGGVKNVAWFFEDAPLPPNDDAPYPPTSGERALPPTSGERAFPQTWGAGGACPFLVWYGDNLSTCDLGRLLQFHREKGGTMTIALFHRKDVTQSGIIGLAGDDRVLRCLGKPGEEEVFSHWVNAGIMVLEPEVLDYIPSDGPSDFGRDVIPAMLAEGERVFGYRMSSDEGLWWIDTPEDLQRTEQEFRRNVLSQ